jgi:hypothetical protein
MIAALFVQEGGSYYGLPDVDPWPESRDARLYPGPYPVVAHPPCERWGRYWYGQTGTPVGSPRRKVLGDDGGCFAAALEAVEKWGGVLEHPEASHAWRAFGLPVPPRHGGWVRVLDRAGWACCVEQGRYGHPARKPTWLYAVVFDPPPLLWGPARGKRRLEDGFHSAEERAAKRAAGVPPVERLTKPERINTPIPFRDLLLDIARSVTCREAA